MDNAAFNYVLLAWALLAVAVFISLFFINAPYGRYLRGRSAQSVNGKLGWIIMEAPAPLVFAACFLTGYDTATVTQVVLLILWQSHYIDRSLIYPLKLRISSNPLPLTVLSAGFVFNLMNAYLNGSYIIMNTTRYTASWLHDIRFLGGLSIFMVGFIVNRHSDLVLYRIRQTLQDTYAIPQGGLFRWISCPNYLGEILLWTGWTVATWSPVAAAFALWTIANLAPRARSHHKWYREYFNDYPEKRRALVPWFW
ncbi:MAG TPA: DUF1295 domain-containing protein [Dehalococcoidia bacterium]|nr:DUF1295 domain-containing protein [Dehalococcoidia bacterium]